MRYAIRNTLYAFPVFLLSWLIYSLVPPYVMQTWKITGDEPHYLLAAHSLVYDGDLDLKNNYLNGDHKPFYFGFLDPHVKEQADGKWLLAHDIGLPVLMAPAYALDGRLGVMRFFAFVGAILAAQMFLLGWEVSGRWQGGALGWLAMAFSAPLALYVFQIYPEMIGGLLVLWSTRQILNTPSWLNPNSHRLGFWSLEFGILKSGLLAFALALLPWLSGRYLPLMLFLVALLVWKQWKRRALWLSVGGAVLASLAIYLAVNFAFFGGPTPSTTASGNAVTAGFSNVAGQQIGRGLAGWLFDQQRGLLVYGPVLIVAFFGLPHLWRLRRFDGLLLLAPFAIMWALASVWGGFYIGWEISARFLIVGVPLLTAGVAAAFSEIGHLKLRVSRLEQDSGKADSSRYSETPNRVIPSDAVPRGISTTTIEIPRHGRSARLGMTHSDFMPKLKLPAFVFWPLAAGLLMLSLVNSALVILAPAYAYKESPIKFYEEATRWQIRSYLPALGTRFIETPGDGRSEWTATIAEGPRYLHQSDGLDELSIGWYSVYAQARLNNAERPDAPALAFDIYSSESGIPLMHAEARPADADPATGVVNLAFRFYDPYYNKWDFPMYLDIQATGAADVQLSWILFEPDPAETTKRVAAWAGGILLLAMGFAGVRLKR